MIATILFAATACSTPPETGKSDTNDTGSTPDTADSTDTADTGETGGDSETGDSNAAVVCDRALPWMHVAAGFRQTCGVHTDGCAECWGAGEEDDVGTGYAWEGEDRPPDLSYRSIHMIRYSEEDGERHSCGILTDGGAVCFGDNKYGEGNLPPGEYLDIAAATHFTVAISADGTVNWFGAIGATVPPAGTFMRAEMDDDYTVLLGSDGALSEYLWLTDLVDYRPGPYIAVSLASMSHGACAVTEGGAVECWREGSYSDPYYEQVDAQAPESGMVDVCVAASGAPMCALAADGSVPCWGYPGENDPLVLDAPTGSDFVQLACGAVHACALTSAGEITCWGYDVYGETIPPT